MITFGAMGSEVTVRVPGGDEAAIAARAAAIFARNEQTFSRFRPDSELERLNRSHGPTAVSAPLFDALERARAYHDLTDGVFDPAIGGALVALGYDRPFAPGALDRDEAAPPPPPGRLRDVVLDAAARTVARPGPLRLDLGGMIKGHTVDEAAALLPADGAIDAGGDAVLRGSDPSGDGWLVDVEDPTCAARTLVTLAVRDAAVATSAANRRRWRVGGGDAHHLIDPRSRRPAEADLLQVTVVAPSAELAEVLAKTAFVLGAREARALLERQRDVGAVLVAADGEARFVGALEVYCE